MRSVVMILVVLGSAQMARAQAVVVDAKNDNDGGLTNALQFGVTIERPPRPPRLSGQGIASKQTTGGNQNGLDFFTGNRPRLSITKDGRIGIGISLPSKMLEIHNAGDVELGLQSDTGGRLWTMQSTGSSGGPLDGTFQIVDRTAQQARLVIDAGGTVSVNVLRITGGADLAEPFPTVNGEMVAGSVVVIDDKHPGHLTLSTSPYDQRVAGVIAGAGGIQSALTLNQLANSGNTGNPDVNVALTGRVYVWADASHGPIRPGDLLTTSETPGHCMKATDAARATGAILGKAMTPLNEGTGLVLVLVTLQ
jgi:hypothetical protein